jgi:hypothetical protein
MAVPCIVLVLIWRELSGFIPKIRGIFLGIFKAAFARIKSFEFLLLSSENPL